MNINIVLNMAIVFLGITSMYTPWFQLRREDSVSGKELSKKYPQHAWMRWGFIILYLLWIAIVFLLLRQSISLAWMKSVASFGGFFASIGLFIGLFAVITGVSILPMRVPWILYVVGDDAQRAGRFQVTWSLGVILLAIVMEILSR